MANSELFWNLLAKRYARKPVPDQTVYEEKLRVTQNLLQKDMRALEFGCGTGTTALLHAEHVSHYEAIDSSGKMIAIANSKLKDRGIDNLNFKKASFDTYEATAESFDMVLGLSILHLVDNPEEALRKAYKLLKPGGYLVTSTACLASESPFIKGFIVVLGFLGLIPKINFLSRAGLQQAIEGLGFEPIYKMAQEKSPQVAFYIHQKIKHE